MKIIRYMDFSGRDNILQVVSVPVREIHEDDLIRLHEYLPEVYDVYTNNGDLYFATKRENLKVRTHNLYLTPAEAVVRDTPWHLIENETWSALQEVYAQEVWSRALSLREQEKEEIAEHKRRREEAERKRKESERQKEEALTEISEKGRAAVTYKKGTFERLMGDVMEETDGYLIVSKSGGTPIGFGVCKSSKNLWSLTHLKTGLVIGKTHFETREQVLTIAGILHNSYPVWNSEDPLSLLTTEDEKEVQRLLREYRNRQWNY